MSTTPPTEFDQPGPVPAPRRRRFKRVLQAALVGAGMVGGAAGSYAIQAQMHPPESAAAESEEPVLPEIAPAKGEPVPNLTGSSLAARIDTLIRAGCYAEALKFCHDAPSTTFGADECALAYREGLCLEGLDRWKDADLAYQKAEKDANVGAWARALLGRARCATARDALPTARAFVDRVLLRSGHPECKGSNVYEEAVHMRTRLAVLGAGARPALDPLDAAALAWPSLRVAAERYLDWLPTDAPTVSPTPDPGRDLVEIYHDPDSDGAPEVTARLSPRPAIDVLRAVATAAGLHVRVENDVAALLAATVGPVEVELHPLDELLTTLTERAGVGYAIHGEVLSLTRTPRAAGPEATAEALRQVLALAPDHPVVGATRVTLANLDLRAGLIRSAARGYKQVLETSASVSEVTHAAYNLGLLELKEGNRGGSRARFLEVIDRAPGTHWADFAWCWVARTHLDGDDTGSARAAYRTVLDGKTKEATSAATLGLCACDLLEGSDESARDLLRETRFSTRESHAMLVALFEAFLRYRLGPTESRHELLLTAAQSADDARGLGPAGLYLAGRVYSELGLTQRVLDLYDTAAETARGPLVMRMMFEAAERYDRLDLRKQARTRYSALAAADPEGIGAQAELRLAALDARAGNGAEAVRRCRTLVTRPGVDRAELLAVMGRGYELQRKFGHAAECFAGRVPGQ